MRGLRPAWVRGQETGAQLPVSGDLRPGGINAQRGTFNAERSRGGKRDGRRTPHLNPLPQGAGDAKGANDDPEWRDTYTTGIPALQFGKWRPDRAWQARLQWKAGRTHLNPLLRTPFRRVGASRGLGSGATLAPRFGLDWCIGSQILQAARLFCIRSRPLGSPWRAAYGVASPPNAFGVGFDIGDPGRSWESSLKSEEGIRDG